MSDHNSPDEISSTPSTSAPPTAPPLSIGMLLYPGFTLLDLAGPQTAFGLVGKTHLIWKTMEPVPTDMGVSMNPTVTFAEVPENLDVLFVPGGFGTVDAMQDKEILDFLANAGSTARYVTSVCTGSVILGMAGLLDGYRAATHWEFYEPLEALGSRPSHERVCCRSEPNHGRWSHGRHRLRLSGHRRDPGTGSRRTDAVGAGI